MGRNHRARWSALGAAVAVSLGAGGLITFVSASSGGASSFVAITPCRLLDTRVDGPATGAPQPRHTPLGQQETLTVPTRGDFGKCVALSPTATGAVLNVTTVNSTAGSYLTVWPADQERPLASNLNWIAHQGATPNQVTTGLDSDGNLNLFNATGTVDVIIDVVGMYEPSSGGGGGDGSGGPGPKGSKGDPGSPGAPGPQGASGTQLMTSSKPDNSASNGQYSSIKIDSSGNPVISHSGGGHLRLTHCDDPACGLSTSNVVDDGGINGDIVGDYTSLQLDSQGLPLISYYDATNGDLKLAHCSDAACGAASTNIVDGDLSGADVGQFTSLQLDANGLPVISYYDASGHQLKLARCADVDCASASSTAVATGEADYGQFSSLVLDPHDGMPTIGYYNSGADSLMVVHCTTEDCTGPQTGGFVDPSAGTNLSMTVDHAGNPVMAYYDSADMALVIARCGDPACATVTTGEPILGLPSATIDPSVVVDPVTDLATASYIDNSNTYSDVVMRIVHCNDAGCTDADSTTPDPVAGELPANTSLILDLHGNPIISRYDSGAAKLNVTHCIDPLCTPHVKVISTP